MSYTTQSFNYPITEEHIAQVPASQRDASWLMVLDRQNQTREHKVFSDIVDYLNPGDLLVFNNTKVIPARLIGRKTTGARCELLLLRDLGNKQWEVLARPGRRLTAGSRIDFGEMQAEIVGDTDFGGKIARFEYAGDFSEHLDKIGLIPLPPYIKKYGVKKFTSLAERYQTVYASEPGAAAAPTAGLHFTPELLEKVRAKGVQTEFITLHTGLGTFRPIAADDIRDHDMHTEWFRIEPRVLEQIRKTRAAGQRIIAVGTTVVRVLETVKDQLDLNQPIEGLTKIYIYPGYEFKLIDAIITNFHLPMSTLLVLVSAFAGKEFVLDAYLEALKKKYRFYSFGDAMFIH